MLIDRGDILCYKLFIVLNLFMNCFVFCNILLVYFLDFVDLVYMWVVCLLRILFCFFYEVIFKCLFWWERDCNFSGIINFILSIENFEGF